MRAGCDSIGGQRRGLPSSACSGTMRTSMADISCHGDLTRALEKAAATGSWLDLSEWRELPVELLHELITGDQTTPPRAIRLRQAHVQGSLDLSATTLGCPVSVERCEFGEIRLDEASAPAIRFIECSLTSLSANQLETSGSIQLTRSTVSGQVSLVGAHIGGDIWFDGVVLANESGPALDAERLTVDGGMYCGGLEAEGEVRLAGAKVGAQLNLNGAKLASKSGHALFADGLRVDRDVFCEGSFSAKGEVSLVGARVGTLSFNGATLAKTSGPALSAEALQVDRGMFCRESFTAEGEVSLVGADVGGELWFDGAVLANESGPALDAERLTVDRGIFCAGLEAEGEVRLAGAKLGAQLNLNGAKLASKSGHALFADGLSVGGDIFCTRGFRCKGELSMVAAQARAISFIGAELANESGRALVADGLSVDQGMLCRDLTATGEVHLPRVHIGGQLNLDGATLRPGPSTMAGSVEGLQGEALRADRLRVDQGMFCRDGFTAMGEVRLPRAHIGGQLSFRGAMLVANQRGRALYADGLRVDDKLSFEPRNGPRDRRRFCPFYAEGDIRLVGAHIGGQLSFDRAEFGPAEEASAGVALSSSHVGRLLTPTDAKASRPETDSETPAGSRLNLDHTRVQGDLLLTFGRAPVEVDLTWARLGGLTDSKSRWPEKFHLRGTVYDNLEDQPSLAAGADVEPTVNSRRKRLWPGEPPDVRRRLEWIRRAEKGESYAPQPYTQLMAFYRQQGRDGDARRVAFERERRRRGQLGWAGKAWNVFLQWTVGYGYRPLRLLVLLGALVIVGSLVFSSFHNADELTAVTTEHPPFDAVIYTFDRLIPFVSLGLRDDFAPTGAAQWWAFAYTLLGWLLTVAVLAGLNAAVRRD